VVARWPFRLCTGQCVVWMPGRGRFGGKRWTAAELRRITSYSYGPPFPRLRCNRQPNLTGAFLCCSVIVRYVPTAFRNPSAAALQNLRDRHSEHRKAAPNRIAPARLRLQVRRLQPDHVGRTGAAGRKAPSPAASLRQAEIDRIKSLISRRRGFLPDHAACKASVKLLAKKRQGHVRGLH